MKDFGLGVLLLIINLNGYAQENKMANERIEIGKSLPNCVFDDVSYYSKGQVNVNEFQGKWFILDCWNRHCISCINSMPRVDSLQKKYGNAVQFLLIGFTGTHYYTASNDDDSIIRSLYENVRKEKNLHLAVAFDSVFFRRFDVGGCPYIVVVDPKGIVYAVTNEIYDKDIKDLINGKQPDLPKAYTRSEEVIMHRINWAVTETLGSKIDGEKKRELIEVLAKALMKDIDNGLIKN